MDYNDLKGYIGAESDDENDVISQCWDTAVVMVTEVFSTAYKAVPQEIVDRVTLEVGNELYNRRNAPSGGSQFATFDGGTLPVRGPRDPLSQVRPIIATYVVPF